MSDFQKFATFYIACWVLVIGAWIWNGVSVAEAIKKPPQTCADELEETRTQLRLRTAELKVAHVQLDSAWKKLKACGVSTAEE